jgi:uncharacterized membrane protein
VGRFRPGLNERNAFAGVTLLIAGLAAFFVAIVQWRYAIFRNDVDLGIFTQVISSTGHGFSSTAEGGVNHLLVHWSPLIVTAWPFLQAFGPLGLEIFQALLIAATLLPVWGLARARFSPGIALGVVAVCALYPILCANAVNDFHEMAFVPLLTATFVYALDRRRWMLGIACTVLLLCTKEDQFVALAFNGAMCVAFAGDDTRMRRFGGLVALLAIGAAVMYFGVTRNVIGPNVAYHSLHFFDWRTSPFSVAAVPSLVAARAGYAVLILAPLAFLPCGSRYGLFLIPGFVEIFASHEPVTLVTGAHYSALLTGYALVAFADGASNLASMRPRVALGAVLAAAAVSLAISIWASPMEYWYYLYRRPDAHDAALERVLQTLPPGADVGSEDEIFAHLGLDWNASIDSAGQEWFVYDRTHYSDRWHLIDEPAIRGLVARRTYTVVRDAGGIVVLHRSPSH